MRKSWLVLLLVFVIGFVVANVLAQSHNNMTEKRVKDRITLYSDVRVGTAMLKAGDYNVVCDTVTVSFVRVGSHEKTLEVPCYGNELKQPAKATEIHTAVDESGVRYLQKLLLRGSTIEHSFK